MNGEILGGLMKTLITNLQKNGKNVEVLVIQQVETSDLATLKKTAEENAREIEEEELKQAEAVAEEQAKLLAEEQKKEYYSKWHLIFICDSLLNDWQLGNEEVDEELVSECKTKVLNGEDVETLLNTYETIKDYFVKVFGEAK